MNDKFDQDLITTGDVLGYESGFASKRISFPQKVPAAVKTAVNTAVDPIWYARHVDWPLFSSTSLSSAAPFSTISTSLYQKLWRASHKAGEALGIHSTSSSSFSASFIGNSSNASMQLHAGTLDSLESQERATGGYYTALGGIMGRVFSGGHSSIGQAPVEDEEHFNPNLTRILRAPKPHCVAAANGCIVTAFDCITANTTSSSNTHITPNSLLASQSPAFSSSKNSASTLAFNTSPSTVPSLRLVSRWNVRRGLSNNSTNSNAGDSFIPLPTPVTKGLGTHEVEAMTRIMHVFVDPTGSHTILSARNGETYYIHSSSKKVRKLPGFGPNPDGSNTCTNIGKAAAAAPALVDTPGTLLDKKSVQYGLTPGSYITSVAFDRKRGTEGATKKILLGSSFGEIYEYSLSIQGQATINTITNILSGSANSSNGSSDTGGCDDLPLLLLILDPATSRLGETGAVTGLHFERLSSNMDVDIQEQSYDGVIVLAAASGMKQRTRLYSFTSTVPTIPSQSFREAFVFSSDSNRNTFVELPGSIDFAHLIICGQSFAMRTETGIYYGSMDIMNGNLRTPNSFSNRSMGVNGLIDVGMIPYENFTNASNKTVPVSIAITNHHFMALFGNDELLFINRMSNAVVQDEKVDWTALATNGTVGSISLDDSLASNNQGELIVDVRHSDQVWLRKSRSLIHVSSACEDRDLWKFALKKLINKAAVDNNIDEKTLDDQFDYAKSLCTNNSNQIAIINAARAQLYLHLGRADVAAKFMAQSPPILMPFTETALRLALPVVNTGATLQNESDRALASLQRNNVPLINYLSEKIRLLKANYDDTIITSILGCWVVELFLHEQSRGIDSKNDIARSNTTATATNIMMQQFLTSNVFRMDSKTVMQSFAYHNVSCADCSTFAIASGDIETAVHVTLFSEKSMGALDALRVLSKFSLEQAEPFYYKYGLELLNRVPLESAKHFLAKYSEGLSATKLLPAFMQYERNRASYREWVLRPDASKYRDNFIDCGPFRNAQNPFSLFVDDQTASMKFFEGVVTLGCRSRAIFNYLISLYSRMEDETPLFRFLSTHIPQIVSSSKNKSALGSAIFIQTQIHSSPLDMSFALRSTLQTGRHYRSAVKLYMALGMRQQAVELAIKVDPVLARELARECVGVDERKRIWLMIARQAAETAENQGGKEVVAKVLSVMKECPDVLSIEDVLSFLPDVAHIDQFKNEICQALTSYSNKIDQYIKEMKDCDHECATLREDITRLQQNGSKMRADARCCFSGKLVIREQEPFYLFPSGYVVLESALKKQVIPLLNENQQKRVAVIEKELNDLRLQLNATNLIERPTWEDDQISSTRIDELQSELDGLIAGDCPLTGYVMVRSIDKGFGGITEDEFYLKNSLSAQ